MMAFPSSHCCSAVFSPLFFSLFADEQSWDRLQSWPIVSVQSTFCIVLALARPWLCWLLHHFELKYKMSVGFGEIWMLSFSCVISFTVEPAEMELPAYGHCMALAEESLGWENWCSEEIDRMDGRNPLDCGWLLKRESGCRVKECQAWDLGCSAFSHLYFLITEQAAFCLCFSFSFFLLCYICTQL